MNRQGAFTLMELTLAIAITATIGVAVAGVAMTISSVHAYSQQCYESTQTGRTAMLRICSAVRKARLVTAVSAGGLALWMGDADGDGNINDDEIIVISYDSSSRQIVQTSVSYPATLDAATRNAINASHPLADLTSVAGSLSAIGANRYKAVRPLADDVGNFSVSTAPSAPLATLARLEMTVGADRTAFTLRNAARLRTDQTADVGVVDDQYVLSLDNNGG